MLAYDWPGNVRELRNVVETLCLLRDGRQVRPIDLPAQLRRQGDVATPESQASPHPQARGSSTITLHLSDGLESMIQQVVTAALELVAGDKIKAAECLRISTRTVQRYVADGRVRVGATRSRGRPTT